MRINIENAGDDVIHDIPVHVIQLPTFLSHIEKLHTIS